LDDQDRDAELRRGRCAVLQVRHLTGAQTPLPKLGGARRVHDVTRWVPPHPSNNGHRSSAVDGPHCPAGEPGLRELVAGAGGEDRRLHIASTVTLAAPVNLTPASIISAWSKGGGPATICRGTVRDRHACRSCPRWPTTRCATERPTSPHVAFVMSTAGRFVTAQSAQRSGRRRVATRHRDIRSPSTRKRRSRATGRVPARRRCSDASCAEYSGIQNHFTRNPVYRFRRRPLSTHRATHNPYRSPPTPPWATPRQGRYPLPTPSPLAAPHIQMEKRGCLRDARKPRQCGSFRNYFTVAEHIERVQQDRPRHRAKSAALCDELVLLGRTLRGVFRIEPRPRRAKAATKRQKQLRSSSKI